MLNDYIENYINDLKSKNLYRDVKNHINKTAANENESIDDTSDLLRRCYYRNSDTNGNINFSSNDYLGLSTHKDSIMAGYKAAVFYGSGSTGSRLLSGNIEIFENFESQIALDKNFESSLIFNSGFIANSSVISSLCIPETVLIFDKLNHASMYHGIDLSKIKLFRYKHLNYNELEDILKKCNAYKNKIIASETVFGMDGDIADVDVLSQLSQKYGALLFLDEAHATGLYGKNGYGLSTNCELDQSQSIIMGTFSKALSSSGAYIACSELIKAYLINNSKGLIYSTALSSFCVGVAMYNWNLLPTLDETRRRIIELTDNFRRKIGELGYKVKGAGTNIVPIIFDSIALMLKTNIELLKNGITASAIRPPTSPTPRIRFAVNTTHSEEDLNRVIDALKQ
ncbi:MAG: pyridoxal phosphate-dependent aminotransferase family protein [Holosporaceae bacterium]|jgi:8-amino-7-oxononanoate synthase|nr:pyridoxal phosphate-dependent aminotransferase family protein [Holosporaceae bacterium]